MPLRTIAWVVSRLPLRVARSIGAGLGWVWFHLLPIRRRVVLDALRARLGMDAGEAWRTAALIYRGLGVSTLELLWLSAANVSRLVARMRIDGEEHFERARARGRGVIVVTAHFGSWDALACTQAARIGRLHVVTKRLSLRWIDRFWQAHRATTGVVLHDVGGAAKAVLRALRAGETVALVVDQDTPPERGGVFAPFLGEACATTAAPAVMAARTGAALVPVRCERDARGELRVIIQPEIALVRARDGKLDVVATTARINDAVGRWVAARPESWLWLHRRWKTRPTSACAMSGGHRDVAIDQPRGYRPEDASPAS